MGRVTSSSGTSLGLPRGGRCRLHFGCDAHGGVAVPPLRWRRWSRRVPLRAADSLLAAAAAAAAAVFAADSGVYQRQAHHLPLLFQNGLLLLELPSLPPERTLKFVPLLGDLVTLLVLLLQGRVQSPLHHLVGLELLPLLVAGLHALFQHLNPLVHYRQAGALGGDGDIVAVVVRVGARVRLRHHHHQRGEVLLVVPGGLGLLLLGATASLVNDVLLHVYVTFGLDCACLEHRDGLCEARDSPPLSHDHAKQRLHAQLRGVHGDRLVAVHRLELLGREEAHGLLGATVFLSPVLGLPEHPLPQHLAKLPNPPLLLSQLLLERLALVKQGARVQGIDEFHALLPFHRELVCGGLLLADLL
mmetsp:Transcript_15730/g.29391  ORF Transcript_15730/g.29391 Transcript_15730/m.29391 type:complete len:359 (-) Transcript_15730:2277-3353(-)